MSTSAHKRRLVQHNG